ncbi:FAD-dependent monooxygenase [Streptomyces cremeus]|uniref:3-amino-4-hydroxybenzoate 2-monooxygenase n=2 Tax=Streptomyces cremeus TaxID=66881 RepID=AHBM_STRCM|nr:RecName: Full=3-amino-4-hydroxybenzoate 2-monooxygenase [Streptomyces cremeus]ALA99209.1 CreL [Streptomyces cremeus]BAU09309.1 flavin dependent monooxygenase [Streptomyces cremeus]
MVDRDIRIAVVGAGVAGLTVAALLRDRGVDCRVFERAPRLVAVGAGIQLSPNGVRVLHGLGLRDSLAATGVRARAIETRSWADGAPIARTPLGDRCEELYGAPYYLIHRADLHRCLTSLLPASAVELGRACARVEERPDAVRLHFTDGTMADADLVIGADGVHSVVRRSVVRDAPRYAGYAVHRGLVPASVVPSFRDDPRVMFWLGPGRHVTYYPVAGGRTVHFSAVGVSPEESPGGGPEDLGAAFGHWHEEVRRVVTSASSVTRWGLYDRDIPDRYATGRVVLLGDAAHPTLPYLSQGANQALEDVTTLVGCLDARPGAPQEAVRQYESLRLPRTAEVHRRARRLAEEFHLPDGPECTDRDQRMRATQDPTHLAWLYGRTAGLPDASDLAPRP